MNRKKISEWEKDQWRYALKATEWGIKIGRMPQGDQNQITDVPGVRVGHATLKAGGRQTGVTVVLPPENPFEVQYTAASEVFNGFGKSIGLMQIDTLGTLESPIALTNTLNVGRVADALIQIAIDQNGNEVSTYNPVVMECNDSYLNDIQTRSVDFQMVREAMDTASARFEEGAIGGGRGMTSFGLKGGIGSASRKIEVGEEAESQSYVLGVLVQTNFGKLQDLRIDGYPVGEKLENGGLKQSTEPDKGSIIVVMATDLPLSSRQIKRILKRSMIGIARTGGYMGNGSGEVAVGFTTASPGDRKNEHAVTERDVLNESLMDLAFRAMAECTEESILNAMFSAETVVGTEGHVRESLGERLGALGSPWRWK